MSYRIEWEQDASDALDRLDASVAQRILLRISWLAANFDNVKPQVLTASLSDYFKLRVGAYRVLYNSKPGRQGTYHRIRRTPPGHLQIVLKFIFCATFNDVFKEVL